MSARIFYGRVESLRGAAAMMVALEHGMSTFMQDAREPLVWDHNGHAWPHGASSVIDFIAMQIFDGSGAVLVFFVMSGFVLSEGLRAEQRSIGAWLRYGVRRFFRIVPGMWVSVVAAAAVYFYWGLPFTWGDVARHLLFADSAMNPPLWSMQVEIILSLLLPIFVWLPPKILWPFAAPFVLFALFHLARSAPSQISALQFLPLFFLGAMVPTFGVFFRRIEKPWPDIIAAACVTLICAARGIQNCFSPSYADFISLVSAPAFFVVSYCVFGDGALARLLDAPSMRSLGRISYSFYVFHYVVLNIAALIAIDIFGQRQLTIEPIWAQLAVTVASIAATLPLAALSFRWIEAPIVAAGRGRLLRPVMEPNSAAAATP